MKKYQQYNYIAFVEVPLQALSLKSLIHPSDVYKVVFLKRKNWTLDTSKLKNLLRHFKSNDCFPLSGLVYFFLLRYRCNGIILPSHLGSYNRLLIVLASFFYKNIIILDDGNYSVKKSKWLEKKLIKNKNIKWYSSFYNNQDIENIYQYSFYYPYPRYEYQNTVFLILPDFEGLGVSMEDEKNILREIQDKNMSDDLIVFPHRRGRTSLYKDLNLRILDDIACFEQWYISSKFKNCKIYSTPSSATWILLDKRLEVTILCEELINLCIEEIAHYKKFDL